MTAPRLIAIAMLALGCAGPAFAAEAGEQTTSVRVFRAEPASPMADRHLKHRIADAALEVCGASSFSLAEVKNAVAHSACWRRSYADGLSQIRGGTETADTTSLTPPPSTSLP